MIILPLSVVKISLQGKSMTVELRKYHFTCRMNFDMDNFGTWLSFGEEQDIGCAIKYQYKSDPGDRTGLRMRAPMQVLKGRI